MGCFDSLPRRRPTSPAPTPRPATSPPPDARFDASTGRLERFLSRAGIVVIVLLCLALAAMSIMLLPFVLDLGGIMLDRFTP